MENQKPIDVLPNEHIAQHRKTQAVLWEEVAHVVQEEDCELNCALTSQTSVTYDGNLVTLRYSVRRYV